MYTLSRLRMLGVILLAFFAQLALVRYLQYGGLRPDIMLVAVVFFGVSFGARYGFEAGLAAGVMKDMLALDYLGINTFVMAMAGFLAGVFYVTIAREGRSIQVLSVFIFSMVAMSVHFFLVSFLSRLTNVTFGEYLIRSVLVSGICNMLLAIPVFSKLSAVLGIKDREIFL